MSEKKFKVGDRVRFIGDYTHYVEEALKNGEVYTISNIDDWGVELSVPMESHVDAEYLELAEPTDPCTAFLQELKELLNRHNAKITFAFRTETRETGIAFEIGDDKENLTWYPFRMDELDPDPAIIWQMPGCNYPLTADNIMDYDKE